MTRIRDDTVVDNTQQGNHLEGYFLLCAGELDVVLGISRPSVWKRQPKSGTDVAVTDLEASICGRLLGI